jgi:hypothetical protein
MKPYRLHIGEHFKFKLCPDDAKMFEGIVRTIDGGTTTFEVANGERIPRSTRELYIYPGGWEEANP